MTFRKGGAKRRRDAVEPAIIEALLACGCKVWQVSGRGLPDLLCYIRGEYFVLEVKTGTGKRTVQQQDIPWPIVRTPREALLVVMVAPVSKRLKRLTGATTQATTASTGTGRV